LIARRTYLRAFILCLLPFFWACQKPRAKAQENPANTFIDNSANGSQGSSVGTRIRYQWGELSNGINALQSHPKPWQIGQPFKVKVRVIQLDQENRLPKDWGQASDAALVQSNSLILAPEQLLFLIGEKQPPPRFLLSRNTEKSLQASPQLTADTALIGSLTFATAESALAAIKGSHKLLSESVIVAEGLSSFCDLYTGREEALLDLESPLQERHPNIVARIGFSQPGQGAQRALDIGLKIQVPGQNEEVVLQPFHVPTTGLSMAFLLRSPFPPLANSTSPQPMLIFLIDCQHSRWSKERYGSLLVEADLARQTVLSAGIFGKPKNTIKNDLVSQSTQLFQNFCLEHALLNPSDKKPLPPLDWRERIQRWGHTAAPLPETALDLLERSFGNAWRPRDRSLREKGCQKWAQEASMALDELADGEVLAELVALNRRALEGNLRQRWRGMEWFRWCFPEIPQARVPFALQPSPAFLVIVDSVLARRGFLSRKIGEKNP
jgi:hypothetical protein